MGVFVLLGACLIVAAGVSAWLGGAWPVALFAFVMALAVGSVGVLVVVPPRRRR